MLTTLGLRRGFTEVPHAGRARVRVGADAKAAVRFLGLLLVCMQSLACADILGIDEPALRSEGSGGSPEAGAGGVVDDSQRPYPKLQGSGTLISHVGSNPERVEIDGPHSVSGCPNGAAEIPLSAGGGEGQYTWELDPPVPGFEV